jgi:sucrose phosphorylase
MRNGVQLITYASRFGSGTIRGVQRLLDGPLEGVFTGVHLLPFFTPYDGADAGFDPVDHTKVDPRLGDWAAVASLAATRDVTADLIANHVSDQSPEFLDFMAKGDDSPHAGMFLTREAVFPGGVDEAELAKVYRPRPGKPFTEITLGDGSVRQMWTTFTPHQIDIDVGNPEGWAYLCRILDRFGAVGISLVRLDAIGYVVKKAGTSCFMIPETLEMIDDLTDEIHARSMVVLVEIHEHYTRQLEIAHQVDRIYDFALPPLVLHSLHSGSGTALRRWLDISPRNAITVLDTHDGIGIVDITPAGDMPGLLTEIEIDNLVESIHRACNGESRQATGVSASNLDLYQVNATFYSALGADDNAYLLARLVQLFAPGIPQIYYAGLLAAENDMEQLHRTGAGRDINRPYFDEEAVVTALKRPVVARLCALARFRNNHQAFNGNFTVGENRPSHLTLQWEHGSARASADLDFEAHEFVLRWSEGNEMRSVHRWSDLPDFV